MIKYAHIRSIHLPPLRQFQFPPKYAVFYFPAHQSLSHIYAKASCTSDKTCSTTKDYYTTTTISNSFHHSIAISNLRRKFSKYGSVPFLNEGLSIFTTIVFARRRSLQVWPFYWRGIFRMSKDGPKFM